MHSNRQGQLTDTDRAIRSACCCFAHHLLAVLACQYKLLVHKVPIRCGLAYCQLLHSVDATLC